MKNSIRLLMIVAVMSLLGVRPSSPIPCKDCVFDTCTMVGGGYGWRTCEELTRARCLVWRTLENGETVCLYWIYVGGDCRLSGGCVDAY